VAVGPVDGKLYVGFISSGEIMRITNPNADLAQQVTELVAVTTDGRGVKGGLAFVGKDLYISEIGGSGVTTIPDPSTCNPFGVFGGCQATLTAITSSFPGAIVSDGVDVLYIGDAPTTNTSSVLRYTISTDTQDVFSTSVPAYVSGFDHVTRTQYASITGLALGPNGDVYVGDDPTAPLTLATPPIGQGHVWRVTAGSAPDIAGTRGGPAQVPPPPSLAGTASLFSWGQTSPHGVVWIPGALGGHFWVGDHTQGLCRMDTIPNGSGEFAANWAACDPAGGDIGSPGQPVYDAQTNFVYVSDNSSKSPGIWRLRFDPATETLSGPVLMAPGSGLDTLRLDAAALGPDGGLYLGGLRQGYIVRINNPRADPADMSVVIIAVTQDQRGINGSIGFIGSDLYLPENGAATVIKNAPACPVQSPAGETPCSTTSLPIPGLTFASSIATDGVDKVYVSSSPGGASATVWRYRPSSGAVVVYSTQGKLPEAGSAASTEYCSLTCIRPPDPGTPFGGVTGFHFTLAMYVDPHNGNLLIADDPLAGARGFHGHIWSVANVA
jgi:hypothetical protein